jgi:hypothetical protein
MFLVDTYVWLERLLDQDRAAEVGDFLDRFPYFPSFTWVIRTNERGGDGRERS